jgi:dihydrofolate synthase / folylpolyglutamate synthase
VNYREALAWLYATQRFGIKLGLENIERLLVALAVVEGRPLQDRPARSAPDNTLVASQSSALPLLSESTVIHVAGTNGKGSVCALIDAVCRAAGYDSGLFTSPHLVTFRERIRVNGGMISDDNVARGLTEIRERVRAWDPHPTFFEIVTALALKHFQQRQCELVILETGMGGRLDATNAVQSSVSVITPIDLDHEKWLGHSIAEIAREKAGIIKAATPVISAPQRPDAESVIRQRADACGASLQFVNETWTKSKIALRGEHQKINAAVALAAVQAANISISADAVARGFESVEWPARFQIWNDKIVIDGAHNPAGAKILAQTWREEFGDERATVILAVLRDKNAAEIIRALAPVGARFVLPQFRSERGLLPDALAHVFSYITPSLPYSISASFSEALATAQAASDRILITGSLHFAGEALAVLRGEPDALEECTQ